VQLWQHLWLKSFVFQAVTLEILNQSCFGESSSEMVLAERGMTPLVWLIAALAVCTLQDVEPVTASSADTSEFRWYSPRHRQALHNDWTLKASPLDMFFVYDSCEMNVRWAMGHAEWVCILTSFAFLVVPLAHWSRLSLSRQTRSRSLWYCGAALVVVTVLSVAHHSLLNPVSQWVDQLGVVLAQSMFFRGMGLHVPLVPIAALGLLGVFNPAFTGMIIFFMFVRLDAAVWSRALNENGSQNSGVVNSFRLSFAQSTSNSGGKHVDDHGSNSSHRRQRLIRWAWQITVLNVIAITCQVLDYTTCPWGQRFYFHAAVHVWLALYCDVGIKFIADTQPAA